MKVKNQTTLRRFFLTISLLTLLGLVPRPAVAAISIRPATWNIIGLDSNRWATGPNRFPVGAKVCSDSAVTNVDAEFFWDSTNANVNLRAGSKSKITIPAIAAGECADAFFEVEVTPVVAAFDTKRKYHITAGGIGGPTTPIGRELYVEHLISQFRNAITGVRLDGVSIPPGGSMSLVVGNTYTIRLEGATAPSGYEQFEAFINFPNTIFQITKVTTTYSTPAVATVPSPHDQLYADACRWENDPNSPNYLTCLGGDKMGGTMFTDYTVKILSGGGTSQTLNTLLYDFSGSSFHYNADFGSGSRIALIVDPNNVNITKSFSPNPTNVGGVSVLTFNLSNNNPAPLTGFNFTDTFPTTPGLMTVYTPPVYSTSGCGSPTFLPVGGAGAISFANGTIAANGTCTVRVNVTTDTVSFPAPPYSNTTSTLKIGSLDTGKTATATLTVNTTPPPVPPPPTCTTPVELARWTMETSQGTTTPPLFFSKAADVNTAEASYVGAGTQFVGAAGGSANSWGATHGSADGWTELPSDSNSYLQFTLDTRKYGGVRMTYDVGLYTSGDWANPNSNVWEKSSADGGGYTLLKAGTPTQASKGSWTTGLVALAATTGTTTTSFRISTDGSGVKKPNGTLNVDNVIFTGCRKPDPPRLTKAFAPDPVAVNGVSTLTFTLTNPNATALTGAKFLDTLPAGLEVAATPAATTTCTGSPVWAPVAGATALAFGQVTGAGIPASGSCTASVDVRATTAGPHPNVSGFISAKESGVNDTPTGVATATLTAVFPPTITKVFGTDPMLAGGISKLTFSITNPNPNKVLSGVAFADTFPLAPGAMVVAPTPNAATSGCGAPTFAPVAGAGSLAFSNGTIVGGGTCEVTVDITAPTTGTYVNTSGAVTHLINGVPVGTNTAGDSLVVNPASPAISLLKQVATSVTGPWSQYAAIAAGANVYYKFTVQNDGDVILAPVTVSDPDPAVSPLLAACPWTLSPLPVAVAANDNHIKTCVVGPILAAGTKLNTATATGTYSATPSTDTSSATYSTIGVTLAKSAVQSHFKAAGTTVDYQYVVANTGSAVLGGAATVVDDKATVTCPAFTTAVLKSDGVTLGDGDNYLDTNEQITCQAVYTVLAADVTAKTLTNIATATISGVNSNTASVTIPLAADLTAVKINSVGGTVQNGGSFDWVLTVSNSINAGSSALFVAGQVVLLDNLPTSGAIYVVGTPKYAGTTGAITCALDAGTSKILTCTAANAVVIPVALTGTLSVTNSSAVVVGSGTAFTSQFMPGSSISIAGVPWTVLSITDDTNLTLLTDYTGPTAAGLAIPGSFSVPVTVTTTAGGSLANPDGSGVCKADSGGVLVEIDENNNDCSDTVTVSNVPSLTMFKTVAIVSDPINGGSSPKSIPGAFMDYTITVNNTGLGAANTTVITDPIPANTEMFVGDITGVAGTGPVLFTDGATASGLTYTFTAINDGADDLSFADTVTFPAYSKGDVTADATTGCDASVTHLKISLGGVLAASDLTNHPSFSLKFRVRIK